MRPHLVIGLGNPLMGDEGVGCVLAERLVSDPRLPEDIEVMVGGTDLLACADRMAGRTRITLLDAILDPSEPGAVRVFEDDFSALETGQPGAHALSAIAALQLLQAAYPELREVRFKLIAVAIDSASLVPRVSPPLAANLPQLLDLVLRGCDTDVEDSPNGAEPRPQGAVQGQPSTASKTAMGSPCSSTT